MIEIESKILNIDCQAVREKLKSVNATFLSEKVFHSLLFRLPPHLSTATLRLRKEGEKSMLTFKTIVESNDPSVKKRNEREVEVGDFDVTKEILLSLGYAIAQDFQKIREEYRLHGASVVIDRFQGRYSVIPPLLEIEAESSVEVKRIAALLGFRENQLSRAGLRDFVVQYGLGELDN